ncbi:hypothetical protein Q1695_014308 [Nippostrongylus brasiliensis]|nr:hypothetical protein Q1695_014308 [Nippostrongylus brasiliensis]
MYTLAEAVQSDVVAFRTEYLRNVLASLCPPGLIDDAERANFLFRHNVFRWNVALRQVKTGKSGYLPGSEEMYEMNYNCELEHIAELSARNCEVAATPNGTSINFRLMRFLIYPLDKMALSFNAVDDWFEPVFHSPIDRNVTYSDRRLESFANMIYYKSLQIGCSIGTCTKGDLQQAVVCVYSSRPQLGSAIYLPAKGTTGCTTFSGCRVIPNSVCNGGLCEAGSEKLLCEIFFRVCCSRGISFTSQIVAATTAEPWSVISTTIAKSATNTERSSTPASYLEPSTTETPEYPSTQDPFYERSTARFETIEPSTDDETPEYPSTQDPFYERSTAGFETIEPSTETPEYPPTQDPFYERSTTRFETIEPSTETPEYPSTQDPFYERSTAGFETIEPSTETREYPSTQDPFYDWSTARIETIEPSTATEGTHYSSHGPYYNLSTVGLGTTPFETRETVTSTEYPSTQDPFYERSTAGFETIEPSTDDETPEYPSTQDPFYERSTAGFETMEPSTETPEYPSTQDPFYERSTARFETIEPSSESPEYPSTEDPFYERSTARFETIEPSTETPEYPSTQDPFYERSTAGFETIEPSTDDETPEYLSTEDPFYERSTARFETIEPSTETPEYPSTQDPFYERSTAGFETIEPSTDDETPEYPSTEDPFYERSTARFETIEPSTETPEYPSTQDPFYERSTARSDTVEPSTETREYPSTQDPFYDWSTARIETIEPSTATEGTHYSSHGPYYNLSTVGLGTTPFETRETVTSTEYPSTAPHHEPSTPATPTKEPHRHHKLHGKISLNMEIDLDE